MNHLAQILRFEIPQLNRNTDDFKFGKLKKKSKKIRPELRIARGNNAQYIDQTVRPELLTLCF